MKSRKSSIVSQSQPSTTGSGSTQPGVALTTGMGLGTKRSSITHPGGQASAISPPLMPTAASATSSLTLTQDEEEEFRAIFNSIDVDGSGSVTPQELADLMKTLNLNVTESEVKALVRDIDENGDGMIQFEEFISVLSRKAHVSYTSQDVKKAFSIIASSVVSEEEDEARHEEGTISMERLKSILLIHSGGAITSDQIDELMIQLRPFMDTKGYLFFNEYVSAVMGGE